MSLPVSSLLKTALCIGLFAGFSGALAQSAGYSYQFSGPGIMGSGDVFLSPTASDGVYSVDSISGQVNGTTISGVLPAGTYNGNDNLFYDNDDFLDGAGVGFSLVDGANVDIYYDGNNYFFQGDGTFQLNDGSSPQPQAEFAGLHSFFALPSDPAVELDSFTFAPLDTTADTPEPAGIVMLGTGLISLAGVVRRRRR